MGEFPSAGYWLVRLPATQHREVILLCMLFFSPLSGSPSQCELGIVRCCDPDFSSRDLPFRCFEANGCPGLYWHGSAVCGKKMFAAAVYSLNRISEIEVRSSSLTITYEEEAKRYKRCPKTWQCTKCKRKNRKRCNRCLAKEECLPPRKKIQDVIQVDATFD